MPAKIMFATTFTCPSPPRNRPTRAMQKFSSRSLIDPAFMMFAATMNSGTASSRKLSYSPWMICSAARPRSWPFTAR